jgi:hypothetical protein
MITNTNGQETWSKLLTENFDIKDQNKLSWVSEYAAIHEIHESALGINATPAGGQNVLPAGQGVGPIYATPLNTNGIGNPYAPGQLSTTSAKPSDLWTQTPGSGDIPVSTLPMALNIALMTIGFELLPVVPAKGPWQMLSYMDFPYSGGKLGRNNEVAGIDGVGEGRENKPLYIKFMVDESQDAVDVAAQVAALKAAVKENDPVTVVGSGVTFNGFFKTFGRMDGGIIVEVKDCKETGENGANKAVADLFADGNGAVLTVGEGNAAKTVNLHHVDYAQTMVDFVDGFANFATGKKEPMTRAQNETGTGNTLSLRLFTKWVEMGSYEVTGQVTRQQLQDLPLYGVDAVAKIMEAMQNEISQTINARILEHVFALGVTNALHQKTFQGVDLNLHMGTTSTTMAATSIKTYADVYGVEHKGTWGTIENAEVNTSAENLHTRQRRIMSRILAAANLIQITGRRGRPTWIVTNGQIATALQDCSGYVVAPMVNGMAQDGSKDLYMAGSVAGLKIYVDPYMAWDDTRICVGRKGNGNEPGAIFMPYILADTVSITTEGTMAPKMLINSRYAIVDAGFFPETMYYTFVIDSPEFGII